MEGQHMVLKQRIYFAWQKYEFPGFTILGKDAMWVEEIYRVLLDVSFVCDRRWT